MDPPTSEQDIVYCNVCQSSVPAVGKLAIGSWNGMILELYTKEHFMHDS